MSILCETDSSCNAKCQDHVETDCSCNTKCQDPIETDSSCIVKCQDPIETATVSSCIECKMPRPC